MNRQIKSQKDWKIDRIMERNANRKKCIIKCRKIQLEKWIELLKCKLKDRLKDRIECKYKY